MTATSAPRGNVTGTDFAYDDDRFDLGESLDFVAENTAIGKALTSAAPEATLDDTYEHDNAPGAAPSALPSPRPGM